MFREKSEPLEDRAITHPVAIGDQRGRVLVLEVRGEDFCDQSDAATQSRVVEHIHDCASSVSDRDPATLAPFGGRKMSGHGRELGPYGIEDFLTLKSLQL